MASPFNLHACYGLISKNPQHPTASYIGYTVNPARRIRQHNGEITMGARKTSRRRPWGMRFCLFGFTDHHLGLQFEWQWQHPLKASRLLHHVQHWMLVSKMIQMGILLPIQQTNSLNNQNAQSITQDSPLTQAMYQTTRLKFTQSLSKSLSKELAINRNELASHPILRCCSRRGIIGLAYTAVLLLTTLPWRNSGLNLVCDPDSFVVFLQQLYTLDYYKRQILGLDEMYPTINPSQNFNNSYGNALNSQNAIGQSKSSKNTKIPKFKAKNNKTVKLAQFPKTGLNQFVKSHTLKYQFKMNELGLQINNDVNKGNQDDDLNAFFSSPTTTSLDSSHQPPSHSIKRSQTISKRTLDSGSDDDDIHSFTQNAIGNQFGGVNGRGLSMLQKSSQFVSKSSQNNPTHSNQIQTMLDNGGNLPNNVVKVEIDNYPLLNIFVANGQLCAQNLPKALRIKLKQKSGAKYEKNDGKVKSKTKKTRSNSKTNKSQSILRSDSSSDDSDDDIGNYMGSDSDGRYNGSFRSNMQKESNSNPINPTTNSQSTINTSNSRLLKYNPATHRLFSPIFIEAFKKNSIPSQTQNSHNNPSHLSCKLCQSLPIPPKSSELYSACLNPDNIFTPFLHNLDANIFKSQFETLQIDPNTGEVVRNITSSIDANDDKMGDFEPNFQCDIIGETIRNLDFTTCPHCLSLFHLNCLIFSKNAPPPTKHSLLAHIDPKPLTLSTCPALDESAKNPKNDSTLTSTTAKLPIKSPKGLDSMHCQEPLLPEVIICPCCSHFIQLSNIINSLYNVTDAPPVSHLSALYPRHGARVERRVILEHTDKNIPNGKMGNNYDGAIVDITDELGHGNSFDDGYIDHEQYEVDYYYDDYGYDDIEDEYDRDDDDDDDDDADDDADADDDDDNVTDESGDDRSDISDNDTQTNHFSLQNIADQSRNYSTQSYTTNTYGGRNTQNDMGIPRLPRLPEQPRKLQQHSSRVQNHKNSTQPTGTLDLSFDHSNSYLNWSTQPTKRKFDFDDLSD